jgi:hypothetical protein
MLSQEDIGVENVSTWEDTIEARIEKQDLKFEKMEAKMDKILEMVTRQASVNSSVETPPVSKVRRLIPSSRGPATPSEDANFRHRFAQSNESSSAERNSNSHPGTSSYKNRNDVNNNNNNNNYYNNNDEYDDDNSECYDLDEVYGNRNDVFEGNSPGHNITNILHSRLSMHSEANFRHKAQSQDTTQSDTPNETTIPVVPLHIGMNIVNKPFISNNFNNKNVSDRTHNDKELVQYNNPHQRKLNVYLKITIIMNIMMIMMNIMMIMMNIMMIVMTLMKYLVVEIILSKGITRVIM